MSGLLLDIILQPRVAQYVECLTVDTWFRSWDDRPSSLHTQYPEKKMVKLVEAVENFVPSHLVATWVTAIESGDEDPIIALLLSQLPELIILEIMDIGVTCQKLFQTLTRLLEKPDLRLLANLTNLTIGWEKSQPDDCHHDWHAINTFAVLPSLQSITAWKIIIGDNDDDSGYLLQPRSSNVSFLAFESCSISAQRLYEYSQGFRALKRFSYQTIDGAGTPLDTFWIRVALLLYAKASLEYLNLLTLDGGEKQHMGSLHDFENLTEV